MDQLRRDQQSSMSTLPFSSIDETALACLVERFYQRAREDEILAPVFARVIPDHDWPEHMSRMVDFWSTSLLGTGRYRGHPIELHRQIEELNSRHFERWIALFEVTVRELFVEEVSAGLIELVGRMRAGMEQAVVTSPSTSASSGAPEPEEASDPTESPEAAPRKSRPGRSLLDRRSP